jgi:hypothetical protein
MSTQEQGAGPTTPPLPQAPPFGPKKPWHERPGIVIVLALVGIVLAGHAIEWIEDATTDELGSDVFDRDVMQLTAAEQTTVERIAVECRRAGN